MQNCWRRWSRRPGCKSTEVPVSLLGATNECETGHENMPTQIIMLGTGTPRPDPDRCGPATAIVVNDTPYLIDFGSGVIRRATAAYEKGIGALGYGGMNI